MLFPCINLTQCCDIRLNAYKRVEQVNVKMKKEQKQDTRLGIRLPSDLRKQAEQLIESGQYRNLSEVLRDGLARLLKENASE